LQLKIGILGLGYVGLTSAGCLLRQGHFVHGVEPNPSKVELLRSGQSPISEPQLEALLKGGIDARSFSVASEADGRLEECDLVFVCVGTPGLPDGSHDMSQVLEASRQLARAIKGHSPARALPVVYRSTMRPGTVEMLIEPVFTAELGEPLRTVELIYNPEFLRESTAVEDYFQPPKIVVGTRDGAGSPQLAELYREIPAPTFNTTIREAELVKFVDNVWHALKVSYANEVGRLCSALGTSAARMLEIFVADRKLNISPYYMRPGPAFGGPCLPKDLRALVALIDDLGLESPVIDAIGASNDAHKSFLFEVCTEGLAPGAKVLLIGLAFKARSDDLRESPQIDLANRLINAGFDLSIYDPGIDPARLTGQNFGYTQAHLPGLARLLVSSETIAATTYAAAFDVFGLAPQLSLGKARIVDLHRLP
jgi:GDP-mannose 6-dehydrogenase